MLSRTLGGGKYDVIVLTLEGSAPSLRIICKQDQKRNNVHICSQSQTCKLF